MLGELPGIRLEASWLPPVQAIVLTSGLPEVRDHRLRQLAQEESQCAEDLRRQGQVLPQLTPLLMLKIS